MISCERRLPLQECMLCWRQLPSRSQTVSSCETFRHDQSLLAVPSTGSIFNQANNSRYLSQPSTVTGISLLKPPRLASRFLIRPVEHSLLKPGKIPLVLLCHKICAVYQTTLPRYGIDRGCETRKGLGFELRYPGLGDGRGYVVVEDLFRVVDEEEAGVFGLVGES